METRVAVISIIVENAGAVEELNNLLHSAGQYIIGRMGIPYRQKGISIISIAIDAQCSFRKNRTSEWCIDQDSIFQCDYKSRRESAK